MSKYQGVTYKNDGLGAGWKYYASISIPTQHQSRVGAKTKTLPGLFLTEIEAAINLDLWAIAHFGRECCSPTAVANKAELESSMHELREPNNERVLLAMTGEMVPYFLPPARKQQQPRRASGLSLSRESSAPAPPPPPTPAELLGRAVAILECVIGALVPFLAASIPPPFSMPVTSCALRRVRDEVATARGARAACGPLAITGLDMAGLLLSALEGAGQGEAAAVHAAVLGVRRRGGSGGGGHAACFSALSATSRWAELVAIAVQLEPCPLVALVDAAMAHAPAGSGGGGGGEDSLDGGSVASMVEEASGAAGGGGAAAALHSLSAYTSASLRTQGTSAAASSSAAAAAAAPPPPLNSERAAVASLTAAVGLLEGGLGSLAGLGPCISALQGVLQREAAGLSVGIEAAAAGRGGGDGDSLALRIVLVDEVDALRPRLRRLLLLHQQQQQMQQAAVAGSKQVD